MTYGYNSNKRGRKQSRSKTKQLVLRRILASLTMAAGILAYPFSIGEAAIVRKDASSAITPEGNVYNIDPEGSSNGFAYNRFKEFDLPQNQIANLKFGDAAALANLVNSKVTINGIVNAVKGGQIDGHLIFLSPNGIAVGATGVINAGQFTGIVPAQDAFNKLYNSHNPATDITLEAINKIKDDGPYAQGGSIDISGKINTHSGVMLGAGIINIKDGAKIQSTKNLDFKDLVNIQSGTNAGLGELTKVEGSGGDIILGARQTSAVKDTKTENNTQTANPIRWSERSTDLSAAVNIGKDKTDQGVSISSSDGAVTLKAETTSTYEDSTPMTLTDTLKGIVLGEQAGVKIVDELIDKLAGKEAGANKYLFVNYSSKKNKASVNIGQNTAITGKNIEVAATSKVDISQSIKVPGGENKTDSNGQTVQSGSKAVAAVAISRVYNNADVVIDGNLTAKGADTEGNGIKITANADTKASLSATGSGGDANAVAIGVAVLTGDTKAKVTVNAPENAAPLSAAKGNVSIEAVTVSDIDVNVGAVGETSYVVSNVGLVNYDTSADVIVNRSVTAGAANINAENMATGLKMKVDNTVEPPSEDDDAEDTATATDEDKQKDDAAATAEKNKPDSEKSEDEIQSERKSIDPTKLIKDASVDTANDEKAKDAAGADGKGGIQDVKDKLEGTNDGGDNEQKTSAFGLGASVGVFSNKNDANVTIGKNVVITAAKPEGAETPDGSVNVSAKSLMTASGAQEESLQFTVKNAQANSAKVEIGAAVLVSNVKNNATVLLDTDGTNSAQITGAGAVSLSADAGMGKYKKDDDDKTSVLSYSVSTEGKAGEEQPAKVLLNGSVGVNTLKNNAVVLLGQNSQVTGSAVTLDSGATTNVQGAYGAEDANAKVGIGATVGLQNISGNSLIMVGKNASLAGSLVSATANNALDTKNEVKNAGKGDSLGVSGMAALSYGDSNSILSLDDEVAINAPGSVVLTSTNSTNVDNSAHSESVGNESSKALGIGVGIVNYDVNSIAMVGDNGSGMTASSGNASDAEKAAKKIYEDATLARSVAGSALATKLGAATTNEALGSITSGNVSVTAVTMGMLKNDAKAKTVSSTAEDKKEDANERSDSEKWTKWSKKGESASGEAKKNTEDLEQDKVTSQNESDAPNASGAGREASSAANPDDNTTADEGSAASGASSGNAGASIGIEGSVALTFLSGRTDAVLDNVMIQKDTAAPADVDSVTLSATDFLGAITLGGTNIKHSLKSDDKAAATKVGIGGTFAMNSSSRDVDALLRNSTLRQVKSVTNTASKTGIEVAAGMGVSASKGNGTNISGAGVVYYNRAKQDIHALMLDNTVTGASDGTGTLSNKATSADYQIAGGLAASSGSGENTNVGVGGAVAISNLENNLSGGITGGSYKNFQSVNVEAQKGTTQINGALAATYNKGKSGYGFEGAFAYGSVKNTTHAYISGASGEDKSIQATTVNVKAGEIPVLKTDEERAAEKQKVDANANLDANTKSMLKGAADADKNNNKILTDTGINPTGQQYVDPTAVSSSLDANAANTDAGAAADEAAGDENAAKAELGQNHSLTITAALAGGLNGSTGVGVGVAYNYVKNDIAADIKGSNITADTVNGEAVSESMIVSVGVGVAVGGKTFNGAGSGSWNDLKNDTRVTFEGNTITGKNISEQAQNTSSIFNIAGEVAGGKGMAMGLSLAYNSLNNTTGTYLTGNDVTLQGSDNSVRLTTTNKSKALAVAAGVDVAATSNALLGASGTVAINRGVNSTESVIDGKVTGNTATNTKLNNVKELSVTATDLTKKTTVAGSVSAGGTKVGIGGAVAYTSVGSEENKEKLRAEINHADVTTTADGTILVSTADSMTEGTTTEKSRITTVGGGIGVSWGSNILNLQGAAAVSDIYKDSLAALNNTNINASGNSSSNHPAVTVEADTRSKINTVGAVANVAVGGKVAGAAGVAINRMNQDTKAEMATDSGTTTVNAGLTKVRATGDGDIHTVGVGGTVSVNGAVSFAGSGSYNYIDNDVNAIIKNQNFTSNSSVGAVAQSDERIYNFAGGFSLGLNAKVGLGAAVAINKITGSTNALVSGGVLKASDTGSITVTRPNDSKLFNTQSLDLTTDSDKLADSRTEEAKTGIVVDSSATHTIISQMASGGVAASGSAGVNLAGTVNLNTITGSTTAKIQDADLNSNDNSANVNVNAVDYTNFGSFTGTASVGAASAAGVSLGVSANWETFDRTTAAEISSGAAKKNVFAKNLTVDATAKHGSSALAFAASAGAAATAGIASGDSIMRHKNTSTTSALLKNTNVVFDGVAEIKAEHIGNSYTQNIGASAAGGYAAVAAGAGVSIMDDTSKVKAEVTNSDLKAKSSVTGKNISVLANNVNDWKNTLVTASLAVGLGAGLAANVGINNTTSETAAVVSGSNLEAYDVNVKATDGLTANATGGVGAAGLGGVGVSVALNNINSSVSTHVTGGSAGGSVKASNNANVTAEEVRSFDSSVTGAAVGGIGAGINVAVTSINKGITDAQLSNATDEKGNSMGTDKGTKDEINIHLNGTTVQKDGKDVHVQGVNDAKGALGVSGAKFYGLNTADKKDLDAAKNTTVTLSTPNTETTPDTWKQGVHTEVSQGVALSAGNDVNVLAKETSDISEKNVTVTVGGAAVGVTDAIIHTNHDTDVTLDQASVAGKNVTIEALQGQKENGKGSDITVTAVTVGAGLGVGVGYAGIVNKGSTDVNITGSTITGLNNEESDSGTAIAENVTILAQDNSKSSTQITNVGVSVLNVTTTFASVENDSNVGVTLGGTNAISASNSIAIDAKKANALEAHTQGVGVGGVNVAVNHATIEDKGTAAAKITGTNGTFTANTFHLGAANDTTSKLSAGNTAVSILGVSRMRGKGVMDLGAAVNVAGGSFNAKRVEFTSILGNANGRTLEGNVKGHNISGVAVAPDAVVLNTAATSTINVANSTFGENTDLILGNESYVDRKAYIHDVTAGAVAVGNTSADISGNETLTTTLTGNTETPNKLARLMLMTYGDNTGKAFADAGGGGLVGYVGAHVDNKSTNTVNSTLSGKWDVAGEVWFFAAQKDETRLTASEGHGGIAGVGGTSVENTIVTNTKATVANGTEITSDSVHIGTTNAITTGAYDDTNGSGATDAQSFTLKDHFGGVISGNRLRSLLDVTENGEITIGENAKISSSNLQEYVAASQNDFTNHVQAKGGGGVVVTDAVTENKINVHNSVSVNSGADLSNEKAASTDDINLSAYDNQSLKAHADATVLAGVVSPLIAKNITTMNRTSNVTVAGTIESGSNVGLYAGADGSGAHSNLNVDLKAGAYNYSVIPITVPNVTYNITADKGIVDVSGTVRSTRDINAIANGGKEEIVKDASKWAWVNGGSSTDKKFLSSDAVTAEESSSEMKKSQVKVTGALIAGTADPINITIGGTVAGGLTFNAPEDNANQKVLKGITQGTFDYANTLGARLEELNKLISAYDGSGENVTAMAAYVTERIRIQNEMARLGLVEKAADGKVTAYIHSGRPVYYVEVPDIATSGGNINVKTNDLIGTGNLQANSAPAVTITNESDAYLKLNNILMGEQGGQIVFGETVIPVGTKEEANAKINEINVSKTGASFSKIYGRTDSTAPNLSVNNTLANPAVSTIKLTAEMKTQMKQEIDKDSRLTEDEKTKLKQDIDNASENLTYTPITDVEVNGKITNYYGIVTIDNKSGNIRISGGTQARPTGVYGKVVKLNAANGSISQDYKEGIVNINGDPEKYLADLATTMKNNLHLSETSADSKNDTKSYTREASTEPTGYIAGRDVYVSAANVNVNGLIQSGYKTYAATVTQAQLDTAKTRPANRTAVVQNRTMYKVNDGGAKWNSTDKVFDYVPQVYWDPSTDKLVVEDIDTQGGKVYLTGKIASTGDGRIMVADGGANISVINQTNLDMNVGRVLNNQREGIITIADTAKDIWTEYRNGQTRRIEGYAAYLKDHTGEFDFYSDVPKIVNNLSVGTTTTYDVLGNQAYTWVSGNSIETTRTYQHYERRGFWGLVQTADESELKAWEKSSNPISENDKKRLGLPEGAVIAQGSNSVPESGKLHLDGSTRLLQARIFDREHWVTRSGFLGWFKHIYDRWKNGTSTIQLYNYSLNASQPITIGLIGAQAGSINLESTNTLGGSINLTGNVANSNNQAPLTINSAGGSIFQHDNTTLKSEIVTLQAKDDIKNIHIVSIGQAVKDSDGKITSVTDNIRLSAISTNTGNIDITAAGGVLENQSLSGNVQLVALKSQNGNTAFSNDADLGDVTLNAAGNITQSGSDTTVVGRGINLTSQNGGIGTDNQAIQIATSDFVYSVDRNGAQVNATAKGNIYLTEAANSGNMRVGTIESKEGDVKLTVIDGGFIDALSDTSASGSTESVDDMVHRWIDAGLIDGEKNKDGKYTYKGAYITGLEKNRDNYKADVELAYKGKTQEQWQAEYNDQKTAVEGIYASAEYRTYLNKKAQYDALTQEARKQLADSNDSEFLAYAESAEKYAQYVKYDTAEAYLKDTAAYKYSQYADANAYLAADATYQDLVNKAANPTFEWTKDMMLYAVSEKMVNPNSGGSTQTERAANILGGNITLLATTGTVGTFADQSITITAEDLAGNESVKYMKQLMSVDASDVTVNRDKDGNLLSFEIKNDMPLGIKASGTLDVQAGGNVSVAGRKDKAGDHSAINVGNIDATKNNKNGNVRLYSDQGIYNDLETEDANQTNIIGNNLILTGGKESIGSSDKPLTVSLTGDLTEARADKDVFIKNMNNADYLRLGAMFAGDTISVESEKGFLMSNANTDIAKSYINAGKTLEFKTNTETGIVGEEINPIRLLNDRAPVNITAESAYIQGMGSIALGIQNGTLVLGNINTKGEFVAESEGSLAVGREEETDDSGKVTKEAVAGSIVAGGDVTLGAKDSLTLDGTVTAGNLGIVKKDLTLTAFNGNIIQTDKGAIAADTVKTFNGKSLLLENAENQFNNIIVDGIETESEPGLVENPAIDGDVRIQDNSEALTVTFNRDVAGDISVTNLLENGTLANGGNLTAEGSIALAAEGRLTQTAGTLLTAGNDVTLTSEFGNVIQDEAEDTTTGIKASKVTVISAEGVDLQGEGNQFGALAVESTDENAPIQGSVLVQDSADKLELSIQPAINGDIAVANTKENGVIQVSSELQAKGDGENVKGDITLLSDGSMQTDRKLTANRDVNLISESGAMTIGGDVSTATGDITLQSKEAMQTTGALTAGDDVNITSTDGAMTVGGAVSTSTGNITLQSKEAMQTTGELTANQNVNITSTDGTMTVGGDVIATNGDIVLQSSGTMQTTGVLTAGDDVSITSGDEISVGGAVSAGDSVSITSTNGAMSIGGDVTASGSGIALQSSGTMQTSGKLTAAKNVKATTAGAMIIGKDVSASNGSIALQSSGTMQTSGVLTASDDVSITSGDEMSVDGDVIASGGDITLQSSGTMQTTGKLTADQNVNITSSDGAMTIGGAVFATTGDIELQSSGTMKTTAELTAGDDVSITSTDGSMSIGGDVTATTGDIELQSKKDMQT